MAKPTPQPKAGRSFVYYVAMSADGRIARTDGRVDWLDSRAAEDYGAQAFMDSVDTIVWGRKTFDHGMQLGGIAMFGDRRHIVLSRHPAPANAPAGVTYTTEPVATLAKRLRSQPGKDVWVMGGADTAGAFLAVGELDRLDVHVIPTMLGDGVPLVRGLPRDVELRLAASKAFPDGTVRLTYDVVAPLPMLK